MKYSVVLALFLGQISSIKIENKLASKKDNNDIQLAAHALRDDDRDDDHDDDDQDDDDSSSDSDVQLNHDDDDHDDDDHDDDDHDDDDSSSDSDV